MMRHLTTTRLWLLALCLRSSSAQGTNSTLVVSEDGNCGGTTGQTCLSSTFGNCCSGQGYCGATSNYCNADCQSEFGQCVVNASSISSDGRCGATDTSSQICIGSSFGSCCSETGWCGSTNEYCGTGCQGDFGDCAGTTTSVVSSSPQTTSLSTQSTSLSSLTSSTVLAATDTVVSPVETPVASTMSTGAKTGVGVGVAAAGVAAIGGILFLFHRRQARKQTPEAAEVIETGSGSAYENKHAYVSVKDLPPTPPPAELGNQHNSRAELGDDLHGHARELDSKEILSPATELPAYKD